ncbi:hypothetical protein FACS1894110_02160 [Spirochaetia bacterium]|nr:hypothetical protein FACS1894110_02160 [Spirochaetia bacterium]
MSKSEWNLGWNDDAKVAAIYYCYLSLDKTDSEEKSRCFAELFDTKRNLDWHLSTLGLKSSNEKLPENEIDLEAYLKTKLKVPDIAAHCGNFLKTIILGGLLPLKSSPYFEVPYSLAFDDFSKVKDEIVKYYDEVIAKFAEDERYECIVEEMDRLSADSYSGFLSPDSRKYLWVFVLYSVSTGILAGEKQKYLNHFCRIIGLDKSVLSEMEETAKSIIALGKKRLEIKASDEAYSKVVGVIETLDAEEQALHEKVGSLIYAFKDTEDGGRDGEESSDDKIYEPYADEDSPLLEKIGGTTMNVLEGIANGLEDFASKF